jgi:hypothetical protein
MNRQELDRQLAAANPVHAHDLGDSAARPEAIALLQHILAQPPASPIRARPGPLRGPGHWDAIRVVSGGTAGRRRLIAAALALLVLGGMQLWPLPANQALASWTPTTQPIDQTTLNEIGAACTAQHRDMPPTPYGAGGQLPAEGWRTVLVDRRGPNAVALVQAPPGHMGVCRFLGLGQVPGPGIGAESSGGGGDTYAPRGDRVLTIENSGGTWVDPGEAIGSTSGQVGPDVARVAVTLDDGTWVQASVGGGWYLAWWPGKVRRFLLWQTTAVRRPQAVRAYDAAGRLLGEARP